MHQIQNFPGLRPDSTDGANSAPPHLLAVDKKWSRGSRETSSKLLHVRLTTQVLESHLCLLSFYGISTLNTRLCKFCRCPRSLSCSDTKDLSWCRDIWRPWSNHRSLRHTSLLRIANTNVQCSSRCLLSSSHRS